ncbi:tyrosine-type recombinase/integrase [Cohaesibacter marisflavi]|uniref:tyrosine-type recombinase/integrase n=1 Tax=Cohaesibacter marisflavi TaxID=655353 RepID=UPI0029C7C4AB|nr:tyrosine-type recombinase/integrase [Cohaesibacter marisflavi]
MASQNCDQCFLNPGSFSYWIDQFCIELNAQRYSSLTIKGYRDSARHFAVWLKSTGIPIGGIDARVVQRFAAHHCQCPGGRQYQRISPKYARRARKFVVFLQNAGVVPIPLKEVPPACPILDDYQHWLRIHRGLSESTIARHLRIVNKLLPELGMETHNYDATRVRAVVHKWREQTKSADLRIITSTLRSYLRFLAGAGLCRPNLDHAIPPVLQWRLSSLPRYLAAADVERVIASCDVLSKGRLRDRAILLLLARLGLRAGDVAGLQLGDIDWNSGILQLSGKARRKVRLPLPQEVGDALLAYIEQERPSTSQDEAVFVGVIAPYRPFAQSSYISGIVANALKRAGISDAPSNGANLLRHSAATSMLRSGATLEAVGTVLRHSSLDMTAHYAKVDIMMLEQIAQPWPGELVC